jgi:hypothetical protein
MNVLNNDHEKIEVIGTLWWWLLSAGLLVSGLYLMFGGAQAGVGFCLVVASGYCMKHGKPVGMVIARCQIPLVRAVSGACQRAFADAQARQAQARQVAVDRERKLAEVRREIDKRLGLVDDNLRYFENEGDATRRILFLKNAQDQVKELSVKRASDEIPAYVLTEEKLLDHAQSTRDHLMRLGLEGDRLHEELLRLFNGFVVVPPPPTVEELRFTQMAAVRGKLQSHADALQLRLKSAAGRVRDFVGGDATPAGVITRLAAVDTCIGRLEVEQDAAKRAQLLDRAYDEIMALAKQKAAGKLAAELLCDADILAHAKDTSGLLDRMGLGNDRVNLGIKRLFAIS